jgi:hypothetical protein
MNHFSPHLIVLLGNLRTNDPRQQLRLLPWMLEQKTIKPKAKTFD